MNATEIVIREVQGDGGFQVRQLLAERIGESGKAPHLHTHGQLLPLDKAGRDVVRIGIAGSGSPVHTLDIISAIRGGEYLPSALSCWPKSPNSLTSCAKSTSSPKASGTAAL